jgi:DNA-binding NarL/FixJ family response regulator
MKDRSTLFPREGLGTPPPWAATFRLSGRDYAILPQQVTQAVFGRKATEPAGRLELDGRTWAVIPLRASQTPGEDPRELLSARELQVACLVAKGCPNKQIAHKLHISEWTVATYLRRIFAKLDVESRAAMAYRCASLIDSQDAAEPGRPVAGRDRTHIPARKPAC